MVRLRRGASTLGCLLSILLMVTLIYFGVNIGEPYLRFFRFQDAMRQEARFAATKTDDDIRRRLAALADSLGLPDHAGRVNVQRGNRRIRISSSYSERVELPLIARDFLFTPRAESSF